MLKGRLPLVISAIFALLAAMVAFLAINQKRNEIAEGWQPVKVLVAKDNLKEGSILTRENLVYGELPARMVTESVITKQDVLNGTPVFGLKLSMGMNRGDLLLIHHIQTKTGGQRMADSIQTKGRAVSIRVSPESSVNHWVEPGDRVDVVGVFRDPQSRQMVSLTMLQNVIVLATGRIGGLTNRRLLSETDMNYSTVTVQVLPEAVEMLVLAQDLGSLYLSLRNAEDNEIKELADGKTTMKTLLTGERSKRISKTQSKIFKVEIIRGKKSERQVVP